MPQARYQSLLLELAHGPPAAATVRDDLYHLKRLGLIDSTGRGPVLSGSSSQGSKNELGNERE